MPSRGSTVAHHLIAAVAATTIVSAVAAAQSPRSASPRSAATVGSCPASPSAVGAIEGSTYFAGRAPAMTLVAIPTATPGCAYYVQTRPHEDRYRIGGLPPGQYEVVGYVTDRRTEWGGGFTDSITCMQTCGASGLCCRNAHHVLIAVSVRANRITRHVTVSDWTPMTGAHATWSPPARPAGVPAAPP